jgi:hypothetical protein
VLGIHEIGQYLHLWQTIQHTTLTTDPYRLILLAGGHFPGIHHKQGLEAHLENWAPPSVKFFHWLAEQDR